MEPLIKFQLVFLLIVFVVVYKYRHQYQAFYQAQMAKSDNEIGRTGRSVVLTLVLLAFALLPLLVGILLGIPPFVS